MGLVFRLLHLHPIAQCSQFWRMLVRTQGRGLLLSCRPRCLGVPFQLYASLVVAFLSTEVFAIVVPDGYAAIARRSLTVSFLGAMPALSVATVFLALWPAIESP
jgi:hypothetical protein